MSAGYSGRLWACPFFHWDERQGIHCEGGCITFQDERTYRGYAKQFCCGAKGWESCTVAKALVDQYERGRET